MKNTQSCLPLKLDSCRLVLFNHLRALVLIDFIFDGTHLNDYILKTHISTNSLL